MNMDKCSICGDKYQYSAKGTLFCPTCTRATTKAIQRRIDNKMRVEVCNLCGNYPCSCGTNDHEEGC